ncbi:helix-turn-helix transcriptional regulator [Solwaraspora sp. WMMD791]|uniref:helix-turn-helix domain-containing protein n=1 Tax=Solwaraspora sp. WMMD791 TaxID=3016086 RepID=UPI00249B3A41|nr:helix-turn-helix transcriptional regulator [Solwaraspora sp. WMMD791]WFE27295.1 helix-turn-helix transcriptional regulator [Solwaraspora sp. WMMD791]
MSPSVLNSSVPRRRLGRELRQLRERLTQLPQTSVASELEWSATKLWRMERGEVPVRSGDVVLLCELYGVDEETTEILAALATKTREKGWWHDYASLPSWFELYVGLEEAASRIREYQSQLVPGFLQTREYATAIFTKDVDGVPRYQIADRVAVRLLTRLEPQAPEFDIVVDEAVLRRVVGSRQIMAAQVRRLADAGRLPNVSVRVLPFSSNLHAGVLTGGSFTILDFPEQYEPTTVYQESITGALFLDKQTESDRYAWVYHDIRSAALSEAESRALLLDTAKEYEP